LNACTRVGNATLALLMPSEDSSIDSDRLASAQRTRARSAQAAAACPGAVMNGCDMNCIL
jgi:hypothetical protein